MSEVSTADVRKQKLAQAIQNEVAKGGRIESQSDYSAIVRYEKPVNHVLHLILTLITIGFWSWVWLLLWILAMVAKQTITLNVDDYGNVLRQKV